MAFIPIDELKGQTQAAPQALDWREALGFRPFFLLAAGSAIALVGVWIAVFVFGAPLATLYGPLGWHGHEMIYGYAAAVIAGFLLTAVTNWTNLPTATGPALAGLVVLWLAGRVLPFFDGRVPRGVIALADLAFLPALGVALARPILKARRRKDLAFLAILTVFTVANLFVHTEALGWTAGTSRPAIFVGLDLTLLLIAIIGGRVLPYFTSKALPGAAPRQNTILDRVAIGATIAFGLARLFALPGWIAGPVAVVATLSHGARLVGWHDRRVWGRPILWVLYVGYGFLVLGYALEAAAAFGAVGAAVPWHAFNVGAIGGLTLGMMSRVGLGHTGRPLVVDPRIRTAFGLLYASAAVRLLAFAVPGAYRGLLTATAGLWVAAFALFLVVYTPILTAARPDGKAG
ncbi:MAG: NnrS family protein [Myxococcales bacterium]|nr:NnrS family protein [Myxococcales bacterium]